MATKLVSILQKESGPFTPSNNLVSIDFEPGNVTDLSKSYLDMEVVFSDQDGNPLPESRVHLGEVVTECKYDASCFVKHATLRSDTVGLIEQQRYVNVYEQNMKQYTMSSEEEKASVALGNSEVVLDASGTGHLIFPLEKILGCAKNGQMFPDYRMGQTRLELELEDKLQVAYAIDVNLMTEFTFTCDVQDSVNEIANATITQPFTSSFAKYFAIGRNYEVEYDVDGGATATAEVTLASFSQDAVTKKVTVVFDEPIDVPNGSDITNLTFLSIEAENPNAFICDDVAGGAAATQVSEFTVNNALVGNFRAGEKYTLGFLVQTTAGLDPADVYDTFTASLKTAIIDVTTPTDIILTFETAYTIPANKELTDVFIFGAPELAHVNWSVTKINLVQAKPLAKQEVKEYVFQTQLLEQVNHPAVNQFRRQVQLEANTDLVVAINPLAGTFLGFDQYNVYRNSVNGIDTITKDVEISHTSNGSLYYDRLLYAFDDLKRLQAGNGLLNVSVVPERITPEQALEPNNVIEFQFQHTIGNPVVAGMWYFFKRHTKAF